VHYRDRGMRCRGRRSEARVLAAYVGKYVGKDPVRAGIGGHRYEVAEGFQPEVVRRSYRSLAASLDQVMWEMTGLRGESLELVWDSSSDEKWRGPPLRYLRFEEREEVA